MASEQVPMASERVPVASEQVPMRSEQVPMRSEFTRGPSWGGWIGSILLQAFENAVDVEVLGGQADGPFDPLAVVGGDLEDRVDDLVGRGEGVFLDADDGQVEVLRLLRHDGVGAEVAGEDQAATAGRSLSPSRSARRAAMMLSFRSPGVMTSVAPSM